MELSSVEEAIAKSSYCVAKAGGAGLGVFALEIIPAGSFLWMYAGKRMRTGDRNAGQAARYIAKQGGDIRYCFRCEDGVTIDASQGGNDSRFVNHFEGVRVCV
jgi:SET domain-containing protein